MRAARDGQAAISQLRSAAQVAAAHGGIGLLWRCQRDRERRGFLAPLRAFFWRHRPNAARTVQFIPSDVHRISNDAAEGDDVTTSPGNATVTYQELTAAVRGDLIMPRDRGMMIRRRRQDNRKLAGSGGPCWRWCRRRSSSPSWTRGWSTSCSRCCSTTFAPAALSGVLLILDVYAVLPGALLLSAGRAIRPPGRTGDATMYLNRLFSADSRFLKIMRSRVASHLPLVRRRDRARGVLLACNVAIPAAASSRPECPAGTGTRRCLPRLTRWLPAAGRSPSSLPGEVGRAACPTCDRRLGVSANAGVAMPRQRILAAIFRALAGVPWRQGTYPQPRPAQRGHPVRSPGTNANGC